jgi:hypothetical protein
MGAPTIEPFREGVAGMRADNTGGVYFAVRRITSQFVARTLYWKSCTLMGFDEYFARYINLGWENFW